MRPASAPSSSSIRAASRRSVAARAAVDGSSQATKRDMCVPFCSAGKATSSDHSATVGTDGAFDPQLDRIAHAAHADALDRQMAIVARRLRVGDVQGVDQVGHVRRQAVQRVSSSMPAIQSIFVSRRRRFFFFLRTRVRAAGVDVLFLYIRRRRRAASIAARPTVLLSDHRSQQRRRGAEAALDRLLDAGGVEPALREELGRIAVLDEGVGQAERAAPASRCAPRPAPPAPRCRRRPGCVPSSTVTIASWRRASSVTSATSSGLTKRMLATVASMRSAAASAGYSNVPNARIAMRLPCGTTRDLAPDLARAERHRGHLRLHRARRRRAPRG